MSQNLITTNQNKAFQKAMAEYSSNYEESGGIHHAVASHSRTFDNFLPNTSIKSEYNRADYEEFRQSERIPKTDKGIISACNKAYTRVGIVRNIIDLMGDFACQGIRLQHPNPSQQKFWQSWFKKVKGRDRSERFMNLLYRLGNVVVYRAFAKLNKSTITKMKRGTAGINKDSDIDLIEEKVYENKVVPLKYTFLCPTALEVINPALSTFTGVKNLGLQLPPNLRTEIRSLIQKKDLEQLKNIPKEILQSIVDGKTIVPLNMSRVSTFFYKKDDWDDWAKPITYAILDDLILLEKMKLADSSALDGAISNVRLWTLGIFDGPNNSILPTKKMMSTLRNILANNVGGGTLDLVWGPELSFKESASSVHQFLGPEKYSVTFDSIYDGMGIPSALRSGGKTTSANSFIGLKALIEKLEYGRNILVEFWENEIKTVCEAMGLDNPPIVCFDQMIISDEAAEKQLLLHLLDRDVIGNETILEKFDLHGSIEKAKVNREKSKRGKSLPHKAGPFHSPEHEHDLRKIILQGGGVAPSELGLELLPKKKGEKSKHDMTMDLKKVAPTKNENTTDLTGRPKNVTETSKRKPKPQGKPSLAYSYSFIDIMIWAQEAQKKISEFVAAGVLDSFSKKDIRSLNKEEMDTFEKIKATALFNLEAYSEISAQIIYDSLNKALSKEDENLIHSLANRFVLINERQPNIEELRSIRVSAYALKNEE